MEKETFQKMVERRGYNLGIHFEEKQGHVTKCLVGDHEAGTELFFHGTQFADLSYEDARDYIDDVLAQEMRHVQHGCGQVLLEANDWWSGMGPYNDFEWGFYLVPLDWGSKPVDRCPKCQQKLSLEGDGEREEMDEETYEKLRPTVLPLVDDSKGKE